MKKSIFLKNTFTILLLLTCFTANAQISEGGLPPSFSSNSILKRAVNPYSIPIKFDINQLKNQDAITEALGAPLRIAQNIDVDIDMQDAGTWNTLDNGQRIWQLSIECADATALILKYNRFLIPEGAKLYIYNRNHSQVLGAYTSKTNPSGGAFATEAIAGENIILEYVDSPNNADSGTAEIEISGIGYCYNYVSVVEKLSSEINRSGTCEVNINCPEGNDWQHQKKGVVKTITPLSDGWYLCSGSVVNNTSESVKPYYLSAHHCFFDDAKDPATFSQMIFYFHFESEGCARPTEDPTTTKTMVGAQLLVDIDIEGGSDGALLLLNEDIPESYDVFYNGWDIRQNIPQSGVGIHHPKGDVKKISTYKSPATTTTWWDGNVYGAVYAHWNIIYSLTANGFGVTEGGSSGSPLFDQNKRIIGTLTGGNSSCSYKTGSNLYGKFNQHWDQYTQKMKNYLDADNTGQTFIDGRYQTDTIRIEFASDLVSIIEGDSIVMKNTTYQGQTYSWTFEGGIPETSTLKNPVVKYEEPGVYNIKLVVNKGLSSEKTLEKKEYITVSPLIGLILPNSLKAEMDIRKDRVNLEWERRGLTRDDDTALDEISLSINRNSDEESNIFNEDNVSNYRLFSKWNTSDMSDYKEIKLNSISIIPTDNMESCIIKIKQDGKDIYSKRVYSLTPNEYNNFKLDYPVAIDVSKDLHIGYEVDNVQNLLASYSNTSIIPERNLLWYDNKNYYAESFGITGNWNIKAEATATKLSDFWYTVSRDGKLLASDITTGNFVDYAPVLSQNSHCYTVDVIFKSNSVSSSETVCVEMPIIDKNAIIIYDKTAKQIRIIPKARIQKVFIYNLAGQTVGKYNGPSDLTPMTINTENIGIGAHIIRIETEQGKVTYKIMIN